MTNLAVHLDVSNLNLTPEPILSSFKVGNVVEVARRKQPGVNEEGGVAEIMEVNSRRGHFFIESVMCLTIAKRMSWTILL